MSKKLMTLAGLLGLQLIPLVSCGVVATQSNIDESSIKLVIPYASYSSAYRSIDTIIKGYNRYVEAENREGRNLLPAQGINWSTSYANDTDRIKNLLKSGTYTELPSLTWNYASLASIAASYDKALEMSGFDTTLIAPGFKALNTRIQGLDPTKIWVVNTGSSGQVNGINGPIFSYVVDSFVRAGAKLSKDSKQREFFKQIASAGSHDRVVVKRIFGPMTKDEGVLSRIKALTIDTRRWENLNDLLEFSELVKRAFPKFQSNIVGFDDPNYLIFSLLYSDLGFDDSKMPIRVMPKDGNDRENQRLDLDNFFNEESRANQLLRGYFKFLKRLIKERVVWFPPRENIWASEEFKEHNLLFAIGSTAGYEYSYVSADQLGYLVSGRYYVPHSIIVRDLRSKHNLLGRLPLDDLKKLEAESLSDDQLGFIVKNSTQGSPTISRVFVSKEEVLKLPEGAGGGDIVISEVDSKRLKPLLSSGATLAYDNPGKIPTEGSSTKMSELKIVESSGKQKSRVVASLKSPLTFVGQEANLQPSELFAIQPPRRFSTKTAFKTTIFQGPVLVGFKLTDKLDKNALEFIRFYSTNKSWERQDDATGEWVRMDITPADYFALSANYITNSVEKLSSPIPESKQNNPYYKVTFNEFKLAALEKDRNFKVYQVPSAVAVQTIYGALKYDVAKLAQPDYDFDSFITDLRSNLGGKRG